MIQDVAIATSTRISIDFEQFCGAYIYSHFIIVSKHGLKCRSVARMAFELSLFWRYKRSVFFIVCVEFFLFQKIYYHHHLRGIQNLESPPQTSTFPPKKHGNKW